MNFDESTWHTHSKSKSVRVGWTRVGKGVFARRSYPATAVVGEITGEIIDDANYSSEYCFDMGDGLHLEPVAPFRFVNHSCEPNCEFDYLENSDYLESSDRPAEKIGKTAFLFALRDIMNGEELTIDYNWPTASAIPCRCQTPSCRGWVVSEDLIDELFDR
jgi:SET domain-containing protein